MREHEHRPANTLQEDVKTTAATEEAESETRFANGSGKPPPVGGAFGEARGTSQLAFEEDANEKELKEKVAKLVTEKFGGDYKAAFAHYDTSRGNSIGKNELVQLLSDAGVGNALTRGTWAKKIIEKLDRNEDQAIAWSEFESIFRATA